jgi:hypothetical protein
LGRFLFVPYFPPLLGALFNGVCQGFIIGMDFRTFIMAPMWVQLVYPRCKVHPTTCAYRHPILEVTFFSPLFYATNPLGAEFFAFEPHPLSLKSFILLEHPSPAVLLNM